MPQDLPFGENGQPYGGDLQPAQPPADPSANPAFQPQTNPASAVHPNDAALQAQARELVKVNKKLTEANAKASRLSSQLRVAQKRSTAFGIVSLVELTFCVALAVLLILSLVALRRLKKARPKVAGSGAGVAPRDSVSESPLTSGSIDALLLARDTIDSVAKTATLEPTLRNVDRLILRALEKQDIKPYSSVSGPFDPTLQTAQNAIPAESLGKNLVVRETIRPGYRCEAGLIRKEDVTVEVCAEKT